VEDKKLWIDIPVEERPYASAFIHAEQYSSLVHGFRQWFDCGLDDLVGFIFQTA